MSRPAGPPRVNRTFLIPPELDEWLTQAAKDEAERYKADVSRSWLVTRALFLLRELQSGIPSEASQLLMDMTLDQLVESESNRETLRSGPHRAWYRPMGGQRCKCDDCKAERATAQRERLKRRRAGDMSDYRRKDVM